MNLALAFALSLLVVWYCCKPDRQIDLMEFKRRLIKLKLGVR